MGYMGLICDMGYSEIYQVTGPVERFAGQIASHGYIVGEMGLHLSTKFTISYRFSVPF
jgi:hypothetical protein